MSLVCRSSSPETSRDSARNSRRRFRTSHPSRENRTQHVPQRIVHQAAAPHGYSYLILCRAYRLPPDHRCFCWQAVMSRQPRSNHPEFRLHRTQPSMYPGAVKATQWCLALSCRHNSVARRREIDPARLNFRGGQQPRHPNWHGPRTTAALNALWRMTRPNASSFGSGVSISPSLSTMTVAAGWNLAASNVASGARSSGRGPTM